MRFLVVLCFIVFVSLLAACKKTDDSCVRLSSNFTITITNEFDNKELIQSGVTGVIEPGATESYTFHAGPGQYFQFAMMFMESNDLFFAASDTGIPLYNAEGIALTGDITSYVDLWDAGTEENEAPGEGLFQGASQESINTGASELGFIRLLSENPDGFTYPDDDEIIRLILSHDGTSEFTLLIQNVSNLASVTTHLASGVWAIHKESINGIFVEGTTASMSFERLVEDGLKIDMADEMLERSGFSSSFSSGVYVIEKSNSLFSLDQSASESLEALAEAGDPNGFNNIFSKIDDTKIRPGESISFDVFAESGDKFSMATMLTESNDWFIALNEIPLFLNGKAFTGDVSGELILCDAGTEHNEYLGAGKNQGERQAETTQGKEESGFVKELTNYSSMQLANFMKVEIVAE